MKTTLPRHFLPFAMCCVLLCALVASCGFVKESRKATANVEVPAVTDSNSDTDMVEVVITDPIEIRPQPDQPAQLPYHATPTQYHDLIHTQLKLRPDWAKRHLLGQASLTLRPHFYATNQLVLDAKGFIINRVELVTPTGNKPLTYTYPNELQLHIQLDKTYNRNETYTIYIDYVARPDLLVEQRPQLFNYENKGLYFINPNNEKNNKKAQELWTQGETEASSCWFPTIDATNQKTSQEIYLTVEKRFKTVANGALVSSTDNADGTRTDYWKQDLPNTPYLFAFAVSEYALTSDTWKRPSDGKMIPVTYYTRPEFERYARNVFGNTPKMIDLFSKLLGVEYPWDKYAQVVVQDFISGAMENTSCTFFFDRMNQTDEEQLAEGDHEDIIAHELFHHWFGDLVTCESWANLALNESFATYGEYIWMEHQYGKERADQHIAADLRAYFTEALTKQEPIIRYYYNDPDTDLFDRHSYQKGCRVIHMLRNYVGDEAFFASLQYYLKAHQYTNVEIDNLRQAFEHTTGEDLTWFFDQWFMTKGHPILDISYAYDSTARQTNIHIKQLQRNGATYRIPTEADIYDASGKSRRVQLNITNADTTFSIASPQRPLTIVFDPNSILLIEKTERKTIGEYIFQYQHSPHFNGRYEALLALQAIPYQTNADKALIDQLYLSAMSDSSAFLRKNAIDHLDLTEANTYLSTTQARLADLATTDPQIMVQTTAIARLADLADGQRYASLLTDLLHHSSDEVIGTALLSLYSIAPNQTLEQIDFLNNNTHESIQPIVARIYAERGTAKHQLYFESCLSSDTSNNTYLLIDYYGDFLRRQTNFRVIGRGLHTLDQFAQQGSNGWLRVNAAQTIVKIKNYLVEQQQGETQNSLPSFVAGNNSATEASEIERHINNINSLLDKIKQNEKDVKVLEYYNGIWSESSN